MSQISLLIFFFFRKEAFGLNISIEKDTTKDKNINISSLKQDFKIWDILYHTNRNTMQQELFQNFLRQEAGAFVNNIKKTQK